MEVMVATRPPSNHIPGADKGRRWRHNIRRLAGSGGYAAKVRERVAGGAVMIMLESLIAFVDKVK
jgi:hypothetical protein